MKKRRKKSKIYFGVNEEDAVIRFIQAESTDEKNKIYREELYEPINTLIDSIIRTFKYYRADLSYEDLHASTLSDLILKFDKFDYDKGTKAYSYYGTIVRRNLINGLRKYANERNKKVSYEDISPSTLEENPDMKYELIEPDESCNVAKNLMITIVDVIKNELETNKKLNDNEKRVGEALIFIFENSTDIELLMMMSDENRKFNKNLILHYLREMTLLNTKEIRNAMKPFKNLYYKVKEKMLK